MEEEHSLDRKDIEILGLLQADGARSNKDLAESVGLSPSACLERVRKLERDGVIERYTALLRPHAFDVVVEGWAQIVLSHRTNAVVEAIITRLCAHDVVVDIYELTGPFDFLVRFVSPSLEDWLLLTRQLEGAFPAIASIRYGLVVTRRANRPLPVTMLIKPD